MNKVESESAILLTSAQASRALAISTRKLFSITASGVIPHVRIGRSVRYRVEALRDYVQSQEVGGTNR